MRARPASATRTSRSRATAATTSSTTTLDLNYDPPTNHIDGVATISATATQNLSSFNLDLVGLNVQAITVDGWDAAWTRDAGELTVTPDGRACARAATFTVVVRYEGVPVTLDSALGASGVFQTDDGMVIAGEPDVRRDLVPGQRPSARQGLLHVQRHRAEGPRGRRPTASCSAGRPSTA